MTPPHGRTRRQRWLWLGPVVGLLVGAGSAAINGCASSESGSAPGTGPSPGPGGSSDAGSGFGAGPGLPPFGSDASSGGLDAGVVLPPEMELESSYEVPVATGRFVWIANPTSGRVAFIDASTLAVKTIEAGNAPTFLAAIPSQTDDAVIVLNALSDDATILRAKGATTTSAATTLTSTTIRGVAHGANAWSISSDGHWAIAWTDARRVPKAVKTESFQDITVIDLKATDATKAKTVLAVGYRPAAVAFAADGARAFAVTEDGISVVELAAVGGPQVTKNVALTDDPTEPADTRDVSVTPDGRLAVVRREGSAVLSVVDLGTGTRTPLDLGGPVTDVDLTASGDRAIAVLRNSSEVVIVPLSAGAPMAAALTRIAVPGEVIGSVAMTPNGTSAILYSNATTAERLTVLTLGPIPETRVVKLHAPVLSVFPAPDGQHAVVIHRLVTEAEAARADAGVAGTGGADGGVGRIIPAQAADAFSLVPLDGSRPARIQATDTAPRAVAISPSSNRALVTVRDDVRKIYAVYLGLLPSLEVRAFPLASPPIAAGVVAAADKGYVAQKHPEGRITFMTLTSGDARTLTGFELGARVVDWSKP